MIKKTCSLFLILCNLLLANDNCCTITTPLVNDTRLNLEGTFLYWSAQEDNLGFALLTGNAPNLDAAKGKVPHPHWKYRPGFKVGAGLNFGCDGWDLYAQYTWLRTGAIKGSISATSSKDLLDFFWNIDALNDLLGSYDTAQEKWRLNFDVVDVELGREFYISSHLIFRPYLGLKGTWQAQKCDLLFFTGDFAGTGTSAEATMKAKENYWGIGIRGGVNSYWQFFENWGIFANVAISGLWESFHVSRHDFFTREITFLGTIDLKDHFNTIEPVFEWSLGIRGEHWFCNCYRLLAEVSWEQQIWFAQNRFIQLIVNRRKGDLTLYGPTLKIGFDF